MKYKKTFSLISVLAIILALLMTSGCSVDRSQAVMTYGSSAVTKNMYNYWISTYKGNILYTYSDSSDTDDFWDTQMSDGITAEQYFNNIAQITVETYLISMEECSKLGISVSSDYYEKIDTLISDMADTYADGSMSELNGYLGIYGINSSVLKQLMVDEYYQTLLQDYLYGDNGVDPVSDDEKNEYYNNNYKRVVQVYVNNKYAYVLDDDGNYTYDSDGNIQKEDLTEDQITAENNKISEIEEKIAANEDPWEIRSDYSEESRDDDGNLPYPNGYYMSYEFASDFITEVVNASMTLETGKWVKVESDYGVHFLYGLDLDEGGYADEDNSDFFEDFDSLVQADLFQKYIDQYTDSITIDQELLDTFSVRTATANYYFS